MAQKSSNSLIKDKDVQILLDRRAEILEQVNKLQAEYQALEHVLLIKHKYEHPTGIQIDIEIDRLKKLKKQEKQISGEERY